MDAETITLPIRPEWRAAVAYLGHPDLAEWLGEVIDDFLETGAGRFYPLLPLAWHEQSFEAMRSTDGHTYTPHPVRGLVAGPFGVFRGSYISPTDPKLDSSTFTLCHVPTGRNIATLSRLRDCKRLAEELAALPYVWHTTEAERVLNSHEEAGPYRDIVRRYRSRPCRPGSASIATFSRRTAGEDGELHRPRLPGAGDPLEQGR